MNYLRDLGFDEKTIELLNENLPQEVLNILNEKEELVTSNISYLKGLGVTNYVDAFVKFYSMFLLDSNKFDEIFSKYDSEDLVIKLEKNVAIMEYL